MISNNHLQYFQILSLLQQFILKRTFRSSVLKKCHKNPNFFFQNHMNMAYFTQEIHEMEGRIYHRHAVYIFTDAIS